MDNPSRAVKEKNLDKIAAEVGFELVDDVKSKSSGEKDLSKELERVINKALGILIEDGLFAYEVWLESRGDREKRYAAEISEKSLDLLKHGRIKLTNSKNLRDAILEISENLQKTLLARQLLERMLIYARYWAKAIQKG